MGAIMKKLFLAGAALTALVSGPAMSADMPVKYKAPPPPVYTWTGCYAGFAGGWLGNHKEYNRSADGTILAPNGGFLNQGETLANDDANGVSGIIGVTVGCNYQVSSMWVVGLEGDFSATRLENSVTRSFDAITNFTPRQETIDSRSDWLATIRARFGVLVTPTALLYVTGGVAFAQDKANFALVTAANSQFSGSDTKTLTGWTVGGGGEWKMDYFGPGWSMKAEYLFVSFPDHSFSSPMTLFNGGAPIPGAVWNTTVRRNYDNIFRLGLNYSFGGYGPVVAKY
jgi:outer membrane immunogenic protein